MQEIWIIFSNTYFHGKKGSIKWQIQGRPVLLLSANWHFDGKLSWTRIYLFQKSLEINLDRLPMDPNPIRFGKRLNLHCFSNIECKSHLPICFFYLWREKMKNVFCSQVALVAKFTILKVHFKTYANYVHTKVFTYFEQFNKSRISYIFCENCPHFKRNI